MGLCSTTSILSRRTQIAEGEKRQKDSPPGFASLRLPPVGGKTTLDLGPFRGAGGSAPSNLGWRARGLTRSKQSAPGKTAPQGSRLSALTGRVSVCCVRMTKDRGPEYSGPLGTFYALELIASKGITFALCCLMASFRALIPFPSPPAKQNAGLTMYVLDRPDFGP